MYKKLHGLKIENFIDKRKKKECEQFNMCIKHEYEHVIR